VAGGGRSGSGKSDVIGDTYGRGNNSPENSRNGIYGSIRKAELAGADIMYTLYRRFVACEADWSYHTDQNRIV
jgi:hypothetical protein